MRCSWRTKTSFKPMTGLISHPLMAKEQGALVMVHAENGDVIDYLFDQALAEGHTDPIYHALTRPSCLEGEATGRAAKLAALADSQLYVVHVTCAEAVEQIARSRNGLSNLGGNLPSIFDAGSIVSWKSRTLKVRNMFGHRRFGEA